MKYVKSISELCGNTPIVQLNNLSPYKNVYLKLESFNPGKSIKDRPVLEMIEQAENNGQLRKGMTIVESTSGNTGIALAMYGGARGYKVLCIVDENIPAEKLALIRAYGAKVEIISGNDKLKNADLTEYRIQRVKYLIQNYPNDYINFNQYVNQANPNAHYKYTGEEILRQAPADLKAVVVSVGTGGSVSGVSRRIKMSRPDIKVYGVEPKGSTLFGGEKGPYLQQGPGNYFVPEVLDYTYIDDHRLIGDSEAFLTTRSLAKNEGLILGASSGAVVAVAMEIAESIGNEGSVLALCPDIGTKYLNTVFSDHWLEVNGIL
ncbi:PLP-dependent cysteine synthase family protein [Priestia koreensis]|uniref:PLP-dependent cysteine synthase family protein n=1 Tax=Priestia koreensis TaxID=284581 RepID=UPI003CFE6F19